MIQTSFELPGEVSFDQSSERMLKARKSRIDLTYRSMIIVSDLRFGVWDLFGIWDLKLGIYTT
jgi:hypothetical protein